MDGKLLLATYRHWAQSTESPAPPKYQNPTCLNCEPSFSFHSRTANASAFRRSRILLVLTMFVQLNIPDQMRMAGRIGALMPGMKPCSTQRHPSCSSTSGTPGRRQDGRAAGMHLLLTELLRRLHRIVPSKISLVLALVSNWPA